MALISSYHGPATRSRAMSVHQSAVYLGSIGGGVAAGLIGQHAGWRSTFWWFASAGTLVILLLLLFLRDPDMDRSTKRETLLPAAPPESFQVSVRSFMANPVALCLVAVFMGANFVAMAYTSWLPTYLHDHFHLSAGNIGINATTYPQVASIFGVFAGGWLADRNAGLRRNGRILVQAGGLLGAVPFLFITGLTGLLPMLLACIVAWGLCKGIYDSNIFASLYDFVPVANRSSSAGLLNSLGWLGGGFTPLVIGMAAQHWGMGRCLSFASLLSLALGGSLWLLARNIGRRDVRLVPSEP